MADMQMIESIMSEQAETIEQLQQEMAELREFVKELPVIRKAVVGLVAQGKGRKEEPRRESQVVTLRDPKGLQALPGERWCCVHGLYIPNRGGGCPTCYGMWADANYHHAKTRR